MKFKIPIKSIIIRLIILGIIYFLVVFGIQVFNAYKIKKENQTSVQVLNAVKKILVLPDNEVPIIKTVTTLDDLNYQPFFMNAEVGDQVIIYQINKKAILYRPSTNQIIRTETLQ